MTWHRGPIGFCAIHPIAYAMGPVRTRRDVCKRGHTNWKANGRTRPDSVWASRELGGKSLGKGHSRKRQTVPPLVKFAGRLVRRCLHSCLRVRADGGTSGPRVGHRPGFLNSTSKSNGGEEAVGPFRGSDPPFFKVNAPDSPSRSPYRKGSRPTPAGQLRGVSRGKRVSQSHGGSECDHLAESVGPRRYVDGGIGRWRCLYDVADVGAVLVLFISCFKNLVKNSRLKSSLLGLAGRFSVWGGGSW